MWEKIGINVDIPHIEGRRGVGILSLHCDCRGRSLYDMFRKGICLLDGTGDPEASLGSVANVGRDIV